MRKDTRTLAERLANWFLEIPVIETGSERAACRQDVRSRSETVVFHLLCVLEQPASIDARKWRREINGRFAEIYNQIRRLNPNFSEPEYAEYLLDALFIFDSLLEDYDLKFERPAAYPATVRARIESILKRAAALLAAGHLPRIENYL